MKKIRFLFKVFSTVTAFVVVAVAVFTTILEPAPMIETVVLWQIPAVSALCTLSCLIYPWNRILGKTEMGIRTVIHYLLVNGIVLGRSPGRASGSNGIGSTGWGAWCPWSSPLPWSSAWYRP